MASLFSLITLSRVLQGPSFMHPYVYKRLLHEPENNEADGDAPQTTDRREMGVLPPSL